MKTIRTEVDSVLGRGAITAGMLSQLPYVVAVIRETLRLHPTAPGFSVVPKSENPGDYPIFIGQERYPVHKDDQFIAVLPEIHKDPTVYGDDADQFKPERMLDEPFNKLPKGAWKVRYITISSFYSSGLLPLEPMQNDQADWLSVDYY